MTSDNNSQSFSYDAWGRTVSAGTMTYGYDALGRRITTNDGATTLHLYYSSQWQVLEEREGTATVAKRQNVWSSVYVDAMVMRDQDSGSDGTLDERVYVQQDSDFNVTSLTDDSGAVIERYTYDPFGEVTVRNADWSIDTGGSDYNWVYLFQGGRLDPATGLYYFRGRDYDADLARWSAPDPKMYVDGANLYEFENDEPAEMLDPMGTDWMQAGGGSGGSNVSERMPTQYPGPRGGPGDGKFYAQPLTAKATDKKGATTRPTSQPTTCPNNKCSSSPKSHGPGWAQGKGYRVNPVPPTSAGTGAPGVIPGWTLASGAVIHPDPDSLHSFPDGTYWLPPLGGGGAGAGYNPGKCYTDFQDCMEKHHVGWALAVLGLNVPNSAWPKTWFEFPTFYQGDDWVHIINGLRYKFSPGWNIPKIPYVRGFGQLTSKASTALTVAAAGWLLGSLLDCVGQTAGDRPPAYDGRIGLPPLG